ncbi:hypothetical protein [Saccharothrix sp. Mg75]|uniref:hypothetical protein n=1 Tax=Saccharothrix sp. Mg75 TaxID=3445357 RepID=UPI003EEBEBE8
MTKALTARKHLPRKGIDLHRKVTAATGYQPSPPEVRQSHSFDPDVVEDVDGKPIGTAVKRMCRLFDEIGDHCPTASTVRHGGNRNWPSPTCRAGLTSR